MSDGARRVADYVADRYALPAPVTCRLLRAYTNDVYAVRSAAGARFALKVYGAGWRTGSEVRYEIDLSAHLAGRGLSVAAPLPRADGDTLGSFAPSGDGPARPAVLFAYARGQKPRPPFSEALYERFGEAIARMHALSDDFASPHARRPLDLACLLDEPLGGIAPLVARREDRDYLDALAARVRARIAALDAGGLDRGPIHGDASLDNLHVTADGAVTLFDFDSGGPGWRAADLQGWASPPGSPHRAQWEAFHRGYASVRTLSPADLLAAPWLTLAGDIWGVYVELDRRVLRRGREPAEAFLRERIRALRERERTLFPES